MTMNGDTPCEKVVIRKRSLTSLTLEWLTEKVKRSERIREKIDSGCYKVDSEKVAAAICVKERSD